MAEDLTPSEPAADDRAEAIDAAPPYQSRFQLIFGVLLGVGLAAVAATVLVLAVGKSTNPDDSLTWSAWHPTAKDGAGALQQIGDHVGQRYTLPSGNQLVAVRGGTLELGGLPVTIAVQQASGDVSIVDKKGVLFTMCGLGKYCSIKEGKPTVARSLVLRRESLELALYTFRYIKNVDDAVVIMPPKPGKKLGYAMFFRRGELGPSLSHPLVATLPNPPPAVNGLKAADRDFLNRLTGPNLFAYAPQQGGDARIYLVLSPP